VCFGVGSYTDSSAQTQPLIETFAGGTWTAAKAPLPSGTGSQQFAYLASIACEATTSCVAVGTYVTATSDEQALVETLSGAAWTATNAPLPNGADPTQAGAALSSVTCPVSGSCAAVGSYGDTARHEQGLIETQTGTTWTGVSAPIPSSEAGQPTTLLFSVACKAVGACAAIGDVGGPDSQSTNHMGLLETSTGGIWSAATAPLPLSAGPNPQVAMSTLSCASSTSCTAIGHLISGGKVQPFFESLAQGQWSGSIASLPADSALQPNADLGSIACPTPVACVAVGFYDDSAGTSHALIETSG
jgi:hypothetical protein